MRRLVLGFGIVLAVVGLAAPAYAHVWAWGSGDCAGNLTLTVRNRKDLPAHVTLDGTDVGTVPPQSDVVVHRQVAVVPGVDRPVDVRAVWVDNTAETARITVPVAACPPSDPPVTTAPNAPVPDSSGPAPDVSAPDTTAPDASGSAPDVSAPDTTAPDTTTPDTSAPDTTTTVVAAVTTTTTAPTARSATGTSDTTATVLTALPHTGTDSRLALLAIAAIATGAALVGITRRR